MPSRKKTVADLADADLQGKKVLVRADLNVPLDVSSLSSQCILLDITHAPSGGNRQKKENLLDLVWTSEEHARQASSQTQTYRFDTT